MDSGPSSVGHGQEYQAVRSDSVRVGIIAAASDPKVLQTLHRSPEDTPISVRGLHDLDRAPANRSQGCLVTDLSRGDTALALR